jgi:hypothetical protein
MILAVLGVLIFALTSLLNRGATNLAGEYVDRQSVNLATLSTLLFSIPILGFILGTLVSLIPYRGLTYKQKYLRSSLMTIIVLDSILLANTIIRNIPF